MTHPGARAFRDTAMILAGLVAATAALLWAAWEVDFGISRTTFVRAVAVLILASFALFAVLFVALLAVERTNHYTGDRTSRLHLPMILSTGGLMTYFGLASIQAVDVFYEPGETWPLMRDPTIQLIAACLILEIVAAKAWLLYEILPPQRWMVWRRSP